MRFAYDDANDHYTREETKFWIPINQINGEEA